MVMTQGITLPQQQPRLSTLPGSSTLVRISDGAWDWTRAVLLGEQPAQEITEEQTDELELAGLLVGSLEDEDSLVLDPHWERLVQEGLRSPVGVDLVCVDGDRAWTSRLRIAGRFVIVLDQERELLAGEDTLRLGRGSSAVILGVTTIEHLSATLEHVVPQRPAFSAAEPAPLPTLRADAPALAEVRMRVTASPTPEDTVTRESTWYALGEQGELLAVLEDEAVRELAPGSLTATMRAEVIAAIGHVTAHVEGSAA